MYAAMYSLFRIILDGVAITAGLMAVILLHQYLYLQSCKIIIGVSFLIGPLFLLFLYIIQMVRKADFSKHADGLFRGCLLNYLIGWIVGVFVVYSLS